MRKAYNRQIVQWGLLYKWYWESQLERTVNGESLIRALNQKKSTEGKEVALTTTVGPADIMVHRWIQG